jgi:hypothetical protein
MSRRSWSPPSRHRGRISVAAPVAIDPTVLDASRPHRFGIGEGLGLALWATGFVDGRTDIFDWHFSLAACCCVMEGPTPPRLPALSLMTREPSGAGRKVSCANRPSRRIMRSSSRWMPCKTLRHSARLAVGGRNLGMTQPNLQIACVDCTPSGGGGKGSFAPRRGFNCVDNQGVWWTALPPAPWPILT